MTEGGHDQSITPIDVQSGLHINIEEVNARLKRYRDIIESFGKLQAREREHIGEAERIIGFPLPSDDADYSEILEDVISLQRREKFFDNKLRGKILVDLGAGSASHVRKIAEKFGVSFLLEVENQFPNKSTGWKDVSRNNLRIIRFREDMLSALARMPDASSNITLNGIDFLILPEGAYRKAVYQEMQRVLAPDGIVFGFGSDFHLMQKWMPESVEGFNEIKQRDRNFFIAERQ